MTEKVIFEFRVKHDEEGGGFEVRHGEDLGFWACCPPHDIPRPPSARWPKPPHSGRDRVRHHMRETLDFFEQMYDDLFGEEEA